MRVSVFGLGYVGTVSCGCFAQDGMEVIGVDVNADKVAQLNAGLSPILEEKIGDMIADAVRARRLTATTDAAAAVLGVQAGSWHALELASKVRAKWLKLLMAIVLIAVAILMLVRPV